MMEKHPSLQSFQVAAKQVTLIPLLILLLSFHTVWQKKKAAITQKTGTR